MKDPGGSTPEVDLPRLLVSQSKQNKGDADIPHFVKHALLANAKALESFRNLAHPTQAIHSLDYGRQEKQLPIR